MNGSRQFFKAIRIALLLVVLFSVLSTYWIQHNVARGWRGSLDVAVIPVLMDDSPSTASYVGSIKESTFKEIHSYLITQAKRYSVDIESGLSIRVMPAIDDLPPALPIDQQGALLQAAATIAWSLKLRWWAWRNKHASFSSSTIRLYVLYQRPQQGMRLAHSTGLQNGLIGIINARAGRQFKRSTNLVLTHELMHILGASDKYDLSTGRPIFPSGYAEPERIPKYPQRVAELMGRSVALSRSKHAVATKLSATLIGPITAAEIGWLGDN